MEALYSREKHRGFTILAFPCNQFGAQEPKSEAEIKEFVKKFNVDFPLFSKINVNGPNTHPVYQFLKGAFPGDVTWNFAAKFLVDRQGIPLRRFGKSDKFAEIDSVVDAVLSHKDDDEANGNDKEKNKPDQQPQAPVQPQVQPDGDAKSNENRRVTRSMASPTGATKPTSSSM